MVASTVVYPIDRYHLGAMELTAPFSKSCFIFLPRKRVLAPILFLALGSSKSASSQEHALVAAGPPRSLYPILQNQLQLV